MDLWVARLPSDKFRRFSDCFAGWVYVCMYVCMYVCIYIYIYVVHVRWHVESKIDRFRVKMCFQEKVDFLKNSCYVLAAVLGICLNPETQVVHRTDRYNQRPDFVLTDALHTVRPSQGKMSLCSSPKSLATWIVLLEELEKIHWNGHFRLRFKLRFHFGSIHQGYCRTSCK